ncbi:MAG: GDP-mannose 4,6-dehydratase [Chloroflexota bacterium]|nr:GDP-mannose 4,6-dehydratase [Chloroflexota bacterium]
MKAIIFGAAGQDGFYLRRACLAEGIEPVGVDRVGGDVSLDVSHFAGVRDLIRESQPDLIFHLAARSTTSHEALFDNHAAIATGALNILESAWQHARQARVFIAGSGLQFANYGQPISETDDFVAGSAYALARIHAAYAARYFRSLGLRTYVGYLFNHESPLRPPAFVSMQVAQAARRIHEGGLTPMEIGSLSVEKEWTFAADVVQAMLLLIRQDEVTEAVIGSGEVHSIGDWVAACFGVWGLDWRRFVVEKSGFSPVYTRLMSNPATIKGLGWEPQVGLQELAAMMVHG